jgi:hypothetical protein
MRSTGYLPHALSIATPGVGSGASDDPLESHMLWEGCPNFQDDQPTVILRDDFVLAEYPCRFFRRSLYSFRKNLTTPEVLSDG